MFKLFCVTMLFVVCMFFHIKPSPKPVHTRSIKYAPWQKVSRPSEAKSEAKPRYRFREVPASYCYRVGDNVFCPEIVCERTGNAVVCPRFPVELTKKFTGSGQT